MNREEINRVLADFNATYVDHEIAKDLREKINLARYDPNRNGVLFIAGATGAGKSALLQSIRRAIDLECAEELKNDLEKIPSLYAEAVPPRIGASFDGVRFNRTLLSSGHEIGINHKISVANQKLPQLYQRRGYEATYAGLSDAVTNLLIHRRPELVFIDEAQNMAMSRAKAREQHYAEIKSLANRGRVPIILFGSYQLVDFARADAQVARRGACFHYRPYPQTDWGRKEFGQTFLALASKLPTGAEKLLEPSTLEYVHDWSLGFIGLVHDWLNRAFMVAAENGARQLELKHLKASAKDSHARETMRRELREGLERFDENDDDEPDIGGAASPVKPKKSGPRPGTLKPRRCAVGMP